MLIVHHIQRGQSERIVWLCEELQIPYELVNHKRDPKTLLAPDSLKKIHPTGAAPVIQDGPVTLAESSACLEYILTKYGPGNLVIPPSSPNYPTYLYWLHWSNSTLQPVISLNMYMNFAGLPSDNPVLQRTQARRAKALQMLEDRSKESTWVAGEEFTAADVMLPFSLSTMRLFTQFDLQDYPHVVGYLGRVGERPAYKRAMEKGDPGFEPALKAKSPEAMRRET